jgi:hypothetical protein
MHLLYNTIRLNVSTIYTNLQSNAPTIQDYTVECIYHICKCMVECTYYTIPWLSNASTIHVNVWSNAPIIWYYTVKCIYHIFECKIKCTYHVCKCMIKCTYYMILYGWMNLPYMRMYEMYLPIIQYYMVECIYHMRLYKRMHLLHETTWSNASTICNYTIQCICV